MSKTETDYEEVGGMKVYSSLQKIQLKDINLNNWNPNFCTDSIRKAIEDDIKKNGFVDPIILQKRNKKLKKNFVIINGEHRFQIFKSLVEQNETKPDNPAIPCTVIDCNDKTAMALTIRLNREHGELMPDKVGKIALELSPNRNIEYLQDMLFLEPDELYLLTDISSKIHKREQEEDDDLQTTREFLDNTEEKATNIATGKEAVVIKGILKVECPQCHAIIDVPH
jgi:hypothetical protein